MGILNVTPDSFSDGGEHYDPDMALHRALTMVAEGADIIDIGGESTRPGSDAVSEQDELSRVVPVLERLRDRISVPLSIDTTKAGVAEAALSLGAAIVNDISALTFDSEMTRVVHESGAGLVIMHIRGTPKTMQVNPHYEDVVAEIKSFLRDRICVAVQAGIPMDSIVVDPGLGFGKRLLDNYSILRNLDQFNELNRPVLIGPSRKSFLGKPFHLPPEDRLEGSLAAITAGVLKGAHIVRVHDVQAARRALAVADTIRGYGIESSES
jgi:dihydropteroate synthase